MEPTRQTGCAIMSARRAAHFERWAEQVLQNLHAVGVAGLQILQPSTIDLQLSLNRFESWLQPGVRRW